MRELKFRHFDERLNDFLFFELLSFGIGQTNDINSFDKDRANMPLEQFTGFQDSTGTDIYENDVVYVAGFGKAKVMISHEYGAEFELSIGCQRSMIDAAAELDIGNILGNIHTNPELLEQK